MVKAGAKRERDEDEKAAGSAILIEEAPPLTRAEARLRRNPTMVRSGSKLIPPLEHEDETAEEGGADYDFEDVGAASDGEGSSATDAMSPLLPADSKSAYPKKAKKRYTIVLDLDETVVYARDGPCHARENLYELLDCMKERKCFEVVVWTAAERKYAKDILQEINRNNVIRHMVYRHKKWFDAKDYTKDLRKLGRDLDYTLIIENTPDCVRANPENGIIVEDFEKATPEDDEEQEEEEAKSPLTPTAPLPAVDHTFTKLIALLKELSESPEGTTIPNFLANSTLLSKQMVQGSNNDKIPIYFMSAKRIRRRKVATATTATKECAQQATGGGDKKVVKVNRDKQTT